MITGSPGQSKTARCAAGIVATKYRLVSADDGTTVIAGPVTTGITATGTLRYKATVTLPSVTGDYEIQWDDGSGTWNFVEDLTVTAASGSGAAAQTLTQAPWPVGTTVSAYHASAVPPNGVNSPPQEAAVTTGTVASDLTVAFPAMANGYYVAQAVVGGVRSTVRFSVP